MRQSRLSALAILFCPAILFSSAWDPIAAQSPASFRDGHSYSVDFPDIDYTPSDVESHDNQRMNIFHPKDKLDGPLPIPAGGFPLLVLVSFNNFNKSNERLSFSYGKGGIVPRIGYAALAQGFAVATVTVTEALPGASYPGRGVTFPPNENPTSSPTAPYNDPTRPYALKDVIHVMQHLRQNAHSYSIHPNRIIVQGESAGASTLMWIAFGPDRIFNLLPPITHLPQGAQPDPQHFKSTVPNGFLCVNGQTFIPLMDQMGTSGAPRFPKQDSGPLYDIPAGILGDAYGGEEYQRLLSPLCYAAGLESGCNPSGTIGNVPTYLAYNIVPTTTDSVWPFLEFTPPNPPTPAEPPHSARFGAIWKQLDPGARFVLYTYREKPLCLLQDCLGTPPSGCNCPLHPDDPLVWTPPLDQLGQDAELRDYASEPLGPFISDVQNWLNETADGRFLNLDREASPDNLCNVRSLEDDSLLEAMGSPVEILCNDYVLSDSLIAAHYYKVYWFPSTGFNFEGGQVPYLTGYGDVEINDVRHFELTLSGAPANAVALLGYGDARGTTPGPNGEGQIVPSGNGLWLNNAASLPESLFTTDPDGNLTMLFPWPNDQGFPAEPRSGEEIYFQFFFADPAATPLGLGIASNAIRRVVP